MQKGGEAERERLKAFPLKLKFSCKIFILILLRDVLLPFMSRSFTNRVHFIAIRIKSSKSSNGFSNLFHFPGKLLS